MFTCINSLKFSPSLVLFMVCRNCSASCPPQSPPSAPPIGCAGCSGNPASLPAPSNMTGYCCCPGNGCPPIKTWFWSCCCSGGVSKAPSVEKVGETEKVFVGKYSATLCFVLILQQRGGNDKQNWSVYLFQGQFAVPSDTPGEYHAQWSLQEDLINLEILTYYM